MDNTDYNETSSLSSYINEFETFAEEVRGSIPEVDFRGRVNRSASDGVICDQLSVECSSQLSIRSEKQASFIKTLLSPRTPYDEFHRLFKNVPKDQFPINDFSCALSRDILLQGRLYISQGWFCFYSNIFGWETQVTIDCSKIESITREKTAYVVPNAILITSHDDKHFFSSFLSRETVYKLLTQVWEEVLVKSKDALATELGNIVNRADQSEEMLLENLPFHDLEEDIIVAESEIQLETSYSHGLQTSTFAYGIENKLSADSGFFDCQAAVLLPSGDLDADKQQLLAFDKSLQEELQHTSSRLPTCASVAICVASIAEMLYSYFQVSSQLIRRLSREQLFILITTLLIMCLMCCSLFLLYRLSVLEPKLFAASSPSKDYIVQQSVQKMLKLRKDIYNAEITRVQKIVSANLEAISQIQETLKMLQDDLMNKIQRNCTLVAEHNVCIRL